MKSPYLLVALFSLLLFADTLEGRKDPAEVLVIRPSSLPVLSSEKNSDCHDQSLKHEDEELFVKDFEPRPNISSYPDDVKEKIFVVDFEPRPSATAYPDEIKSGEEVLAKNKNPSFGQNMNPGQMSLFTVARPPYNGIIIIVFSSSE